MLPEVPSVLQGPTQNLIDSLLASGPISRYREACDRLDADPHASALLARLSDTQTKLRRLQASGGVTQSDIDALRQVQEEARNDAAFLEYARCQQEAISFLKEVNTEISELLGVDFAALANRATC